MIEMRVCLYRCRDRLLRSRIDRRPDENASTAGAEKDEVKKCVQKCSQYYFTPLVKIIYQQSRITKYSIRYDIDSAGFVFGLP
jgi:hypothetical protein